ncbi:hypothetical protein BJ165DRAFT_1408342 [Panaeolus papilionaceus]|nr:hypothetical protein BJ165DRAFT_1408342 [Panaeolus papilionaceus]
MYLVVRTRSTGGFVEGWIIGGAHGDIGFLANAAGSRRERFPDIESLLSQSESNAIQSFLSSMDYTDDHSATISASEWALFSGHAPEYTTNDDLIDPMSNPESKDALTKATKDLMSLDSDRWSNNDSSSMMNHQHLQQQQQQQTSPQNHFDARGQIMTYSQQVMNQHSTNHIHPHQSIQQAGHVSFTQGGAQTQSSQDVFPFLHSKPQQQGIHYSMTMQQHPLSLSTLNTNPSDQPLSASSSMTPTTPISPFAFPPNHHHLSQQQQHLQQQQQALHQHTARHQQQQQQSSFQPPQLQIQTRQNVSHNAHASPSSSSPQGSTPSASSSRSASAMSPNGSGPSVGINGQTNGKPRRGASPRTNGNGVHTSTISTNGASSGSGQPKQTLLSPSQKKANHIQSEQKRRANIRREAIREEEEAERRMRAGIGPGPGARKKTRGKKGKDGDEKEKVDGRAGPRSENVVLSKTIDHIQSLLADRSELLARLHHARSSLPPGHPALTPLAADPPWEREWKGGEGKLGDEENEGEEEGSDEDA